MGRKKLLVIDDEYHIRLLFFEELEEEGYEVVTDDGTRDILELVDREKPDAVILDLKLEENRSGFDLLRAIRSRDQKLPVIICTAFDVLHDDLQTIDADFFVVKSIDVSELKNSITNALKKAESLYNLNTELSF